MRFFNFIKGVTARVVVGLAGVLVARILSKEEYGLIVSIAALSAFFLTVSRLGLNEYVIVRSAKTPVKSLRIVFLKTLDRLQNTSAFIMFFPGVILSFMLFRNGHGPGVLFLLFLAIYLRGYVDVIRNGVVCADLQSTGNNGEYINAQLVFAFASLAALAALFVFRLDGVGYAYALLLATIVFHVFGLWLVSKHVEAKCILTPGFSSVLFYRRGLGSVFSRKKAYFFSEVMAYFYAQGNVLALASVSDSAEVARFSVVSSLIMAGYIVPGVIYQWSLPRLAALRRERSLFLNEAFKNFRQIAFLTFLPGGFIFLFSHQIIDILLGAKYSSSAEVLRLMALVFVVHSICFIPAACLTALGRQVERSRIQFLGGAIGVAITAMLSLFYGANGAAVGCLIAELVLVFGYLKSAIVAVNYISMGGK